MKNIIYIILILNVVSAFFGCLPQIPLTEQDENVDGSVTEDDAGGANSFFSITDKDGNDWPLTAAPRRPHLLIHSAGGLEGTPTPIILFKGSIDEDWLDDLERADLTKAHQDTLLEILITQSESQIEIIPTETLELGETYTVAIAGWATYSNGTAYSEIWSESFTIAENEAGAVVVASFPADGASGIDPAIPLAFVAFDDLIQNSDNILLKDNLGNIIQTAINEQDCSSLGLQEKTCIKLTVLEELKPISTYHIVVDETVLDRGGSSIGPWSTTFTTHSETPESLEIVPFECAIDEINTNNICVLVQDEAIRFRFTTNIASYGMLISDTTLIPFFAPRGEASLSLDGLSSEQTYPILIRMIDSSARIYESSFDISTSQPLATLSISEILFDPQGKEPYQEYIEIENYGTQSIDINGFSISDRLSTIGDSISETTVIPPYGKALLVPDNFDPSNDEDVAASAGAILIRIGSALATSGISNSGEPIFLRDAEGRRVAETPSLPSEDEGSCLVRITAQARISEDTDYEFSEPGGCTPGW